MKIYEDSLMVPPFRLYLNIFLIYDLYIIIFFIEKNVQKNIFFVKEFEIEICTYTPLNKDKFRCKVVIFLYKVNPCKKKTKIHTYIIV